MKTNMIKIIVGVAALAGCAYGVFAYEKSKLASKIKRVKCIDIQFVKEWIGKQDMEKYNKSYTVVMMRGKDIPNSKFIQLFFDISKMAAICLYDKNSKTVVTKEFFLTENFSQDFGSDEFIEFPFEM